MIHLRKISKVTSHTKTEGPSSVKGRRGSSPLVSPFAIKPPDSLKGITERKTQLSEIQRLAILQRALQPYAKEAEKKLSPELLKMKEEVRKEMITKGFPQEVAGEAADEAVSVILETKTKHS